MSNYTRHNINMLCCVQCLSHLKIKMPKTAKSSLIFIKRQLSWTNDRRTKVKFLIVGLGNYCMPSTRHSIGMTAIDRLAVQCGVTWARQKKLNGYLSEPVITEKMELLLLKSKYPMNLNGKSIYKAANQFEIPAAQVYLIHDELDKLPGTYGIKNGGSARGHKGVRSASEHLLTDVMPRLLIGIGRPTSKAEVVKHVLENFTSEEKKIVNSSISDALGTMMTHIEKRCEDILQTRAQLEESPSNGKELT